MKLKENIALSESGFVFNPMNGESFTINETGRHILQLLKEGKDEDEIIEQINNEYQTKKMNVEKDIQDFLELIKRYQLAD